MIRTANLTKVFTTKAKKFFSFHRMDQKKITALNHVTVEVRRGELFGLLGPNGAGKTTFIKILSTLLIPDEGTAYVNGFSILEDPMNVKKSMGTLFSVGDRGFFWRLSGYKNLQFYASIYNVPGNKRKERIQEVFEIVGLSNESSLMYQRYSLGMKRKLMLARALLSDPCVLLLDEPTASLDAMSARHIRSYIKGKLCKELGKTVIYTTHNLEEAAQVCDKICILHKGCVLAYDTPNAVKNMIKTQKVIELVVKSVSSSQIKQIQTLGNTNVEYQIDNELNQVKVQLYANELDSLLSIVRFISQNQIELVDLVYKKPTLEEAFTYIIAEGNKNV